MIPRMEVLKQRQGKNHFNGTLLSLMQKAHRRLRRSSMGQ